MIKKKNSKEIKMKMILFALIISISQISCDQSKSTNENLIQSPIVISDAWMRTGTQNRNSAAFMKITNNTDIDDTLISTESDLAKVTELHETYEKGNDMMGMRHVDYLVIPRKSKVELKPGSFHIMLIGLNKDLVIGDSDKLTLTFRNNGGVEFPIKVEVK